MCDMETQDVELCFLGGLWHRRDSAPSMDGLSIGCLEGGNLIGVQIVSHCGLLELGGGGRNVLQGFHLDLCVGFFSLF
ncbi:hypothetical protein RLOC_00002538 [Lonchura striata]|uniref:Uncharacterized protein n=1 Tax=Lonchura striata TaxID=40157 RepID=A0A218VA33_9PASE|nr:hypothetical protein RLOC_00002538 [Lonchura striata domestica]